MKKFNINDEVYIQITLEGWQHLYNTVGESYINTCIKSREVLIDGETWYKLQCWGAFDLFPPDFGGKALMRTNIMIDDDVLKFCDEKQHQLNKEVSNIKIELNL